MKQCCTDRNGDPKKKYRSREEAEKAARRERNETVGQTVYPCDEGDGRHLASPNASSPTSRQSVITRDARVALNGHTGNPLADSTKREVVKRLADYARPGALQLLEEKIAGFQRDTEEKTEAVRRLRRQIAALKNELESAERDLKASQRKLSNARFEYHRSERPA